MKTLENTKFTIRLGKGKVEISSDIGSNGSHDSSHDDKYLTQGLKIDGNKSSAINKFSKSRKIIKNPKNFKGLKSL